MIQEYFKNELEEKYPMLRWSIDYYESNGNVGVVYSETANPPSTYDDKVRFPNYMIFIRDTDWQRAESIAYDLVGLFNGRLAETFISSNGKKYSILFIEATSDANRLGVNANYMEYSVNFKVTLKEVI